MTYEGFTNEKYEAAIAALNAPLPASAIKSKAGQFGKYTTLEFVYDQLDTIVGPGNWTFDAQVIAYGRSATQKVNKQGDTKQLLGALKGTLTIYGVPKSDAYDIELPDEVMYGGPISNTWARVVKRCGRLHGIAAELWRDEEDVPAQSQRGAASVVGTRGKPATRGAGARGGAVTTKFPGSDKQRGVLVKSGLPDDFIDRLTMGDLRNEIIGAMMKARTNNATDAIKAALEVVTDQTYELLAPLYGAGTGGDGLLDDEDDSPYDDDDEA